MRTLITFHSSHAAMEAELLGEEAGFSCRLVPLPPDISAGCGLVLMCGEAEVEGVLALLLNHAVPVEEVYSGMPGHWKRRETA